MSGNVISPPPYFDVTAYEGTVRLLRSLSPRRLLTAHFEVMEGEDAVRFLDESAAFIERARLTVSEALAEHGELTLRGVLEISNPALGPFTLMENELAGTLRAHLRELVASGRAGEVPGEGVRPGSCPIWVSSAAAKSGRSDGGEEEKEKA
jgi:hypothetical protein